MPAELFFREKWGPRTLAQVRDVCAACPVRTDCLDYAIANGEELGVWGGLTPDQRTLVAASQPRTGTTAQLTRSSPPTAPQTARTGGRSV